MGQRIYTVTDEVSLATGTADLCTLNPAADKPLLIKGFRLSQITDTGDANEKLAKIYIRRFTATVTAGSGGNTPTPVPTDDVDAAAGFTVRTFDTTLATTTGTNEIKERLVWNVRMSPFEVWYPDDDYAPKCRLNANRLLLRLETAIGSTCDVALTVWIKES